MSRDIRERAFKLYRAPFRFEQGYIFDAHNEVVADDHVPEENDATKAPEFISAVALALARVRGWGRIKYKPDNAELQDAVGALIAEALTKLWHEHFNKK